MSKENKKMLFLWLGALLSGTAWILTDDQDYLLFFLAFIVIGQVRSK